MIIAQGSFPSAELPDWLALYWYNSLQGHATTDFNEKDNYQNFYYRVYPEHAAELFGITAGNFGLLELNFYEDENGLVHYSVYTAKK